MQHTALLGALMLLVSYGACESYASFSHYRGPHIPIVIELEGGFDKMCLEPLWCQGYCL
jgi:hypothetical protein